MQGHSLRLSDEELALLLETLAIPQLAGHPATSLTEIAPVQAEMLRPTLTRSLAARDLMLPQADGGWAVNSDVQRLLRLSAAPDAALLVTSKTGDTLRPQQESYYRLGDVVVRYYQPYDGINDFALLAEPLNLAPALMAWLQRHTAGEGGPVWQVALTQASLSQAQAAANQGAAAEVEQMLRQAGASLETSSALAAAMTTPAARLQVAVLSPHLQPTVQSETFLCDARRCWSVQEEAEPTPLVVLETIDLAGVASLLQHLIASWEGSLSISEPGA